MELKYGIYSRACVELLVLIEPLWNWNVLVGIRALDVILVLIEPLWNWNYIDIADDVKEECLNRTFMELKYL